MAESSARDFPGGVEITGALATGYDEILTPDALSFVAKFHRAFESRRRECLQRRQDRQEAIESAKSSIIREKGKVFLEADVSSKR
jgi:malate synthase